VQRIGYRPGLVLPYSSSLSGIQVAHFFFDLIQL
jgi:hypothetical protein